MKRSGDPDQVFALEALENMDDRLFYLYGRLSRGHDWSREDFQQMCEILLVSIRTQQELVRRVDPKLILPRVDDRPTALGEGYQSS